MPRVHANIWNHVSTGRSSHLAYILLIHIFYLLIDVDCYNGMKNKICLLKKIVYLVLNNAEAVEEKEWNFIVLTLLNLELPRGLMHVIPRRPECWKAMLMSLGIKL